MEQLRLVLPKPMLKKLEGVGIYCQTWVTVEKQARAARWVLRAVESGGSTNDVGRYISFFAPGGGRLTWLQRMDRIGCNGVHAVVVAEALLSVEMARVDQTYQLLVVQHSLGTDANAKKPPVQAKVLFRGIDGQLSEALRKQGLVPEFFARSGEVKTIPEELADAVKAVTHGVTCVNCKHVHGLTEKTTTADQPLVSIAS